MDRIKDVHSRIVKTLNTTERIALESVLKQLQTAKALVDEVYKDIGIDPNTQYQVDNEGNLVVIEVEYLEDEPDSVS